MLVWCGHGSIWSLDVGAGGHASGLHPFHLAVGLSPLQLSFVVIFLFVL